MISRLVGFLVLATATLLASALPAGADDDTATAPIRRASEAYIAALERGDADQLARLWTSGGDFMDSSGRVTKGRELARQAGRRASGGRSNLLVTVDSIRLITADVAIEDGITESSADNGGLTVVRYSAVWVRRDGQWLLDTVRESAPQEPTAHDYLRLLAWMVGDWAQEQGDERVEVRCRWSPDKNFLLREIRVGKQEDPALTISQRIGWDAEKKQLTAWTFDSEGAHAIGQLQRQGNEWLISTRSVLPDGQVVSGISKCTRIDNDRYTWESSQQSPLAGPGGSRKLQFVRQPQAKAQ